MIAVTTGSPPLDCDDIGVVPCSDWYDGKLRKTTVSRVLASNGQNERCPRRQGSLRKEYKWSGIQGVHGCRDPGNTNV